MGINGLEQSLGEAWKLGVELEMDACGQPGEAFEQPFDIRIGAGFFGIAVQSETASDLRIFARERRPLGSHRGQIAFLPWWQSWMASLSSQASRVITHPGYRAATAERSAWRWPHF